LSESKFTTPLKNMTVIRQDNLAGNSGYHVKIKIYFNRVLKDPSIHMDLFI